VVAALPSDHPLYQRRGSDSNVQRTLIINFKNYREVFGEGSLRLARAAKEVATRVKAEIVVAPPHPMLALVASRVRIPVFAQSVEEAEEGKSTGAVIAEAVRASGVEGVLLNHSESRLPRETVGRLVSRSANVGLRTCVCASSEGEAVSLSRFRPTYLAVEPPELIGSGVAVSRARPGLIKDTVGLLRKVGYSGMILCGAGIVDGRDVERAVQLGVDGVLVSSSVVKASDWKSKIMELAEPLSLRKP
jgi:triosephosphate isomerase